jgi:phage shock protein A
MNLKNLIEIARMDISGAHYTDALAKLATVSENLDTLYTRIAELEAALVVAKDALAAAKADTYRGLFGNGPSF